tara:strand:- start:80 stop:409 length:330 start_codon:yes stop_codon:yes gene_type:complete
MIKSKEFKDDLVSDFVKSGAKTLINKDFENNIMLKIKAEIDYKKEVSSYLKKSLYFFLLALFSGIIFMFYILFEEYVIKSIAILILFTLTIFGILCIDNYRIIIKKYSW